MIQPSRKATIEEGNYNGRADADGSIFNMPVGEHIEEPGIVKEENTNHREDSKPVKVIKPVSCCHGTRCSNL